MSPIQQTLTMAEDTAPALNESENGVQRLAGHASGWICYQRDHARLPLVVAFADSLAAFAAKTGHPATAARLHPADLDPLGALAAEAGLAVLTGGGVTVQPGTWGLA